MFRGCRRYLLSPVRGTSPSATTERPGPKPLVLTNNKIRLLSSREPPIPYMYLLEKLESESQGASTYSFLECYCCLSLETRFYFPASDLDQDRNRYYPTWSAKRYHRPNAG